MTVTVAKTAGFCYGVNRAVTLAEKTAREGTPCVMLGEIIHNEHVISHLKEIGMGQIAEPEDAPEGASVLIRSHGEARSVYDRLAEQGSQVIDATCPSVARIHRLVQEAEQEGRQPVIVGLPTHPEVKAIAGWCRSPVVLEDAAALEKWLAEDEKRGEMPLTFVFQTTSTRTTMKNCENLAKKQCTNAKLFDTICIATAQRQSEAQELAAQSDVMIVIGDHQSANTRHLAELCRQQCDRVYWIEEADELPMDELEGASRVGITAGASTPGWIIKEVKTKMSNEVKMEIEESFAEMLEKSIKTLNTGDKVVGTVVQITPTDIQVDLGTKHAGYIAMSEFSDDPNVKAEEVLKPGDQIEVLVLRVNDSEGVVSLSKKRLDANKNWEEVEAAKDNKTVIEATIREENKGGVVANYKGIRVFIPASQTGLRRNEPMTGLVGTTVRMHITEVNRSRRRVVGSIRSVASEERAAKSKAVWESIEVGKHYSGTVKSLTSYGAFVDIGGVDGMVHISELSWSRIKHPSEVVSVGDPVDVYVIKYDPEKKKISLGMKDPNENPWETFLNKYSVGDVATVKVVKLMTFGAFAEVVPGVDGLIHISQIADHRVEKPEDELQEGDVVDVKITDINLETRKVSLSRRAVLLDAED
ncbi:MAG: bifunctional 4-hydroxy-3-methylbut-2-enyl diphosphate reductase/30S ribosomal protein S1 [Clostridiales bacterium]|nr:bifunctional 4-hydroxy-3-methylbut-2-enyl diphosphate reductase/30S ribosomal protein S1 [Clostridiales bacterium]MCD7753748.1 bifunctional 4-hydroxy-3-methylbut-2-enyl diphosphate reductase/30S ribosomal protein S1 [Clostridiales bacterium]